MYLLLVLVWKVKLPVMHVFRSMQKVMVLLNMLMLMKFMFVMIVTKKKNW